MVSSFFIGGGDFFAGGALLYIRRYNKSSLYTCGGIIDDRPSNSRIEPQRGWGSCNLTSGDPFLVLNGLFLSPLYYINRKNHQRRRMRLGMNNEMKENLDAFSSGSKGGNNECQYMLV